MATSGIPTILLSPELEPPINGLYASAKDITPSDKRWESGFSFEQDGCGNSRVQLLSPCDGTKTILTDDEPIQSYTPFAAFAGVRCSAFSHKAINWDARVRRRLLSCEGRAVAHELWTGTVAQANSYSNKYLTDIISGDTVTNGPTSVTQALACLEEAIMDGVCGQQGMIHATPQVVTLWMGEGLLIPDRVNNQIRTIHGNIVVSDGGYDGSGPAGVPAAAGSVWAYATDMVYVMRGKVDVFGGPNAEGVSRSDNVIEIRAERAVAAFWTSCRHFAAEINAPLCGIGGAGS